MHCKMRSMKFIQNYYNEHTKIEFGMLIVVILYELHTSHFAMWARGICLICMPEALGPAALGLQAYISGNSRVHMLQVICNTSGTLKICLNLTSIFPPLYIVTGTRCDCGTLFHRCHDVLAW